MTSWPDRRDDKNTMNKYRLLRTIRAQGHGPAQFAHALRGIAFGGDQTLYAVGDKKVVVFDPRGEPLRTWATDKPGHAIAVDPNGSVYVGQDGQVEISDNHGRQRRTWRDPQHMGLITAIAFSGDSILLADAKARRIHVYDREKNFQRDIGHENRMRGFVIPNRHLDLAVDAQGVLHAPSSGQHRVVRFKLDGERLGHVGRFGGPDPSGFSGCCNPTNLALFDDGRFAVTVKAPPEVKIFTSEGALLGRIKAAAFDANCKNMDIAIDKQERIYVVDTERLHVLVFVPVSETATQPATAAPTETESP